MSGIIMYVKFKEETGEVLGVGPRPDINHNTIPVDIDTVRGIIKGTDSKKNWKVEFNAKSKKLELVDIHKQIFDGATVNDYIYEIPETCCDDPDIIVQQNIPESCWKILIGKGLKKNLRAKGIRLNTNLTLSITAKHDPNVLFKSISIDFSKVVNNNYAIIDFSMPFEYEKEEISIFTSKKFGSYQFQRIFL